MADPVYTTAEEFKAGRSGAIEHGDDDLIKRLLSAAEYKIDAYCGREAAGFLAGDTATDREYAGDGTQLIFIDECVEVSAVAVKTTAVETSYTSWASTDWLAASGYPWMADFNRTPYTFLMIAEGGSQTAFTNGLLGTRSAPTVKVTAKWGYATEGSRVMDLVKSAVLAQTSRWHARHGSKWADTVAGPEYSTLLYRQEIDPDIKDMLVNGGLVKDPLAVGVAL